MGTGAAERHIPLQQAMERQAQDAILPPERTGLFAGARQCLKTGPKGRRPNLPGSDRRGNSPAAG